MAAEQITTNISIFKIINMPPRETVSPFFGQFSETQLIFLNSELVTLKNQCLFSFVITYKIYNCRQSIQLPGSNGINQMFYL